MDEVRSRLIPESNHDRSDIDRAYEAMHSLADSALVRGHSIIVDATYGRSLQRAELERIARRRQVPTYLVQCEVSPGLAVFRFKGRGGHHPAIDLTEERVFMLAATYPYCDVGLLVDTDQILHKCLRCIDSYLATVDHSITIGKWSDSARETAWPGPLGYSG
jgi:hypothetical protein